MSVDTTGIQELILTILKAIATFDIKTLDFDYLGVVLTMIAPVWNPIWAAVNEFLHEYFGF
ncbi:MAG: hypothetical protein IJ395_01430 [Clostridia bacterium]|nr:hypothetical protein [Clostridia bacterium]